jgi:hypothetical protein
MVRSESLVAKDEEAVLEALLCWMSVGSHAPLSLRGEKLARHIRFGTIPVSACASQSLSHSLCRCGCRCGCGCGCGCEAWKTYPIWHHSVPTLSLSLFVSLSLSLSLSLSVCPVCSLPFAAYMRARTHTVTRWRVQPQRLQELLSRPHIKRSSKVRSYIEQGLAVQQSGARGQVVTTTKPRHTTD